MKKSHLIFVMTTMMFSQQNFAETIKILKIKGNKAVFEFKDTEIKEGNIYQLATESVKPTGSKKSFIELSGEILNRSTTTGTIKTTGTIIDLSSRYGLNHERYEFGATARFFTDSRAEVDASSMSIGPFFDYNFVANIPGINSTYGVGTEVLAGQMKISGVTGISYFEIFPYGFFKWFINSNTAALSLKLGYSNSTIGTSPEISNADVKLALGLMLYF